MKMQGNTLKLKSTLKNSNNRNRRLSLGLNLNNKHQNNSRCLQTKSIGLDHFNLKHSNSFNNPSPNPVQMSTHFHFNRFQIPNLIIRYNKNKWILIVSANNLLSNKKNKTIRLICLPLIIITHNLIPLNNSNSNNNNRNRLYSSNSGVNK